MPDALVITKQLSKTYLRGRQPVSAILDVNLAIQPGEFVALIGRSGSGKSTLLSLLGGLDSPTAGQVIIAGTDLSALNPKRSAIFRRQQIGFLFQSVDLLPTLTVLENVMLPAALAGTGVVEYTEQAWHLLDAVGVQPLVDKLPDQLSGGERQRVGIARALINHPRLILADEPTGSLDRRAGQSIIDLLRQMAREQQMTVILATHDPEVTREADRMITLNDGRILLAH